MPPKLTKPIAMLTLCLSAIALLSCGSKPLNVRAAQPICPEPPKPPKTLTDPVQRPSFLSEIS